MTQDTLQMRLEYPHVAPFYVSEYLDRIANSYHAYANDIAERTSTLSLDALVDLANSNAVSASQFITSENGYHGSLAAMDRLIALQTKLHPADQASAIRDKVAADLEEAAQLAVSQRICDEVFSKVIAPTGISDAALESLSAYAPNNPTVLKATVSGMYDMYVSNYYKCYPSEIIEDTAVAFGHLGGDQMVQIDGGKSKITELTLDEYKINFILSEREDYKLLSRKHGGRDEGVESALQAIDLLPVQSLGIKISEESRPTALGSKVITASVHTRTALKATAEVTKIGATKVAEVSRRHRIKTAALLVIGSMATGAVGLQSAQASPQRTKSDRPANSKNHEDDGGIVIDAPLVNAAMTAQASKRHSRSHSNKEHGQQKEQYKGHTLTPEIRDSLKEIISRDNPWKNRAIATLFYMKRGFTLEQAVGHVGNFMVESKMPGSDMDVNPNAHQLGNDVGQGIAQWTKSDRWDVLVKFAIKHDMDPRDLLTQLEFTMYEYDGPENIAYQGMKNATSVTDATLAFLRLYERAGNPHGTRRIENANLVFDEIIRGAKAIQRKNGDQPKPQLPPVALPIENTPVVPPETVAPQSPQIPILGEPESIAYPVDFVFATPPASGATVSADNTVLSGPTVALEIAYDAEPVYTAAPAIELPSETVVPNPAITVSPEVTPTIPQNIAPENSATGIVIELPSTIVSTPEQPTPPPGQLPLPQPDIVWAPPIANTPPAEQPPATAPEQPPVMTAPTPQPYQPPAIDLLPTPPITQLVPPELHIPEIVPPVILAPIFIPPVETILPVVPVPPVVNTPPPEIVIPEAPQPRDQPNNPDKPNIDEKPKDNNKADGGSKAGENKNTDAAFTQSGDTHDTNKGYAVPDKIGTADNEVVYFSQHDDRWADKSYSVNPGSGQDISASGCGPASQAIVLSTLLGRVVSPLETAKFNLENGFRTPNNGTSFGSMKAIADEYGVDERPLEQTMDTLRAFFAQPGKQLAVVNGRDQDSDTPATRSGHIFTIRGITDEGQLLIADPNRLDSTLTSWKPSEIMGPATVMYGYSQK